MKGLGDMMKQAQAVQEHLLQLQEEMASMEVKGESGAGLVTIVMNGRHEVRQVTLNSSLLEEDKAVIEDLLAAAFNDAVRKVEAGRQNKVSGMARGLGLPLDKLQF
ncbi:MAG: YbaB/EbfC family nucleoid-associated protein [Gammaproteobacteria bacterium]|nr:YbaB/EbfC family nucleoid-associated protein [Gammaproteobacteria bacterium]